MADEIVYTVAEANALIPWLSERLSDLADAAARLGAARSKADSLKSLSRSNGHGDIDARLSEADDLADSEMEALHRIVEEIRERGIQVRDLEAGLADFPGDRDGTPVWLCWKRDEREIGYWHDTCSGFMSRRPL